MNALRTVYNGGSTRLNGTSDHPPFSIARNFSEDWRAPSGQNDTTYYSLRNKILVLYESDTGYYSINNGNLFIPAHSGLFVPFKNEWSTNPSNFDELTIISANSINTSEICYGICNIDYSDSHNTYLPNYYYRGPGNSLNNPGVSITQDVENSYRFSVGNKLHYIFIVNTSSTNLFISKIIIKKTRT